MPTPLPAAVSDAVAPLWGGPVRPGRVLACFPAALYAVAGAEVVAVVCRDASRLPVAAVLAEPSSARPFAAVRPGQPATLGGGELRAGRLRVRMVRTWPATPRLPGTTPAGLARGLAALAAGLQRSEQRPGLPAAELPRPPWPAAADRLLGRGPGLTPSGDDLIAGVLVGLTLLPRALGRPAPGGLAELVRLVHAEAPRRTTALSTALLRAAARGQPSAEVTHLLGALTAPDTVGVQPAAAGLLGVGATSGADLAHGVLAAGRAVVDEPDGRWPWPSRSRSGAGTTATR